MALRWAVRRSFTRWRTTRWCIGTHPSVVLKSVNAPLYKSETRCNLSTFSQPFNKSLSTAASAPSVGEDQSAALLDEEDHSRLLQEAQERYRKLRSAEKSSNSDITSALQQILKHQDALQQWSEAAATSQMLIQCLQESPPTVNLQYDIASLQERCGTFLVRGASCSSAGRHELNAAVHLYLGMLQEFSDGNDSDGRSLRHSIGRTLNVLACSYIHAEEYDLALTYLQQAEQHYRVLLDDEELSEEEEQASRVILARPVPTVTKKPTIHLGWTEDFAKVLHNQAVTYRETGLFKEAVACYEEMGIYLTDAEKQRENELDLSDCYHAMGEYVQARHYLETLLLDITTERRESGQDETALEGVIRHNLGEILLKQSHLEEALEHLECAYRVKKKFVGEVHPELMKTLNALGAVHSGRGNSRDALTCFRESLLIARANVDDPTRPHEEDPQVKLILRNIALVEKQGPSSGHFPSGETNTRTPA